MERNAGTQRRYMATVGTFDGVHRGHVSLLEQLKTESSRRGLTPLALAIDPHPLTILKPEAAPPILTLPEQRIELIRRCTGVETHTLHLSDNDFRLTGTQFLRRLNEGWSIEAFMMGFNNHIGSDRATASGLADACIPVTTASHCTDGAQISSSAVRSALIAGDIAAATSLLGHPFTYRGRIAHGKQLGRTIGFPTANIEAFDTSQLLPATGVYAVDIEIRGYGRPLRGIANIGRRPTVERLSSAPISFEAHILGFEGDIYGETTDISFLAYLREERRFDSLASLRAQLCLDAAAAAVIQSCR